MKRLLLNAGAAVLALIPITSLLVLFEVVTFPRSHRVMGYLIAGYLALVLVLLARLILIDVWRWLWRRQGGSLVSVRRPAAGSREHSHVP